MHNKNKNKQVHITKTKTQKMRTQQESNELELKIPAQWHLQIQNKERCSSVLLGLGGKWTGKRRQETQKPWCQGHML